jgi:phosphoribosylformylglycinamidine synthase
MTAFGAAATVIGEVGGEAVAVEGSFSVALTELERAFTRGLSDLLD